MREGVAKLGNIGVLEIFRAKSKNIKTVNACVLAFYVFMASREKDQKDCLLEFCNCLGRGRPTNTQRQNIYHILVPLQSESFLLRQSSRG